MKNEFKQIVKDIPMVLLGNLCIAFAATFLVLPNNILVGGSAGLAVAITAFFDFDKTMVVNVITVSMFLLGLIVLGRKFAIKTMISSIAMPSFLWIGTQVYDMFPTETFQLTSLTACIFSGVIIGFGVGVVFRTGASTGGMDIPPLVLNKFTGIPLPVLVMIVDGITVLLGVIGYGLEASLQGIISVWVSSYMVNKTLTLGSYKAKKVLIISDAYEALLDRINVELNRGSTIMEGSGGYTQEKRPVLMTVISNKQYPKLLEIMKEVDKGAFIVVSDVNEVHGQGFTYEEEIS